MMELAKFRCEWSKGEVRIQIDPDTGFLTIESGPAHRFAPVDFIEIADAMKRAALASNGIQQAWHDQQRAMAKSHREFQEKVKDIL